MSDSNYFLNTDIIGDFNDLTLDNSGYGSLSAAEKNQTYFAYFAAVGGTGPEIIDQTAYFVKYLIDAKGNVVAPQPNSIDLTNMLQNFEPGKVVNVTSLEGTSLFSSLLGSKTITNIGIIEPILISQTGSGVQDRAPKLYFTNNGANYAYSSYDFRFYAKKPATDQNLSVSSTAITFTSETFDTNGLYDTSNSWYTFLSGTAAHNNPVSFKTQLNVWPQYGYDSVTFAPDINQPLPTEVTVYIKSSPVGSSAFPTVLTQQTFNITQPTKISVRTPYTSFNSGSKIQIQANTSPPNPIGGLYAGPWIAGGSDSYFTCFPLYANEFTSSLSYYWTTGSISTNYLTASTELGNAYSFGLRQLNPTSSLGFSTIALPFNAKPGDYIRFEYNPEKTFTIYEIVTDGEYNLNLRLNKDIPTGTNINNFVIYRVNPNNGNQIILDVKKPVGTTGQSLTGFLKPQHMSKELEDNFTTIIQKLAAEGTI